MVATQPMPGTGGRYNANDRLKGSFRSWYWGSIAAAALLHLAGIALSPDLSVADWSRPSTVADVLPPVHEHRVPPPPEEFARPLVPTLGAVDVSADITLPEMDQLFRSRAEVPPPPLQSGAAIEDQPAFTPRTVEPELRAAQRAELTRHLERNYPPALRDAGIAARVVMWVFINEQGRVQNTRVVESSGYPAFDQLADQALRNVTFSPAMNRDQRVPVWIQLPVSFQVR